MPTYDYVCDECRYHFEEFQSIKAEPLTKCPKCHGHVRRLIGTGNGFLFKGNGFYTTDYRSENYKSSKQKEEGTGSSSNEATVATASEKAASSKSLTENSVKKSE